MRLVGDYFYYIFWSLGGLSVLTLLIRIDRKLGQLLTVWEGR